MADVNIETFDFEEWANTLVANLADRTATYQGETDVEFRRNKAASMLIAVIGQLQFLPQMCDPNFLLPLSHISRMLVDLDNGRKHVWAKPSGAVGSRVSTSSDVQIHLWSVASWLMFRDASVPAKAAYAAVSRAGSRGTGKDIGWRDVQRWQRRWSAGDPRLKRVNDLVAKWRGIACPHGKQVGNCGGNQAICTQAGILAEEVASLIFANSWFFSDGSDRTN